MVIDDEPGSPGLQGDADAFSAVYEQHGPAVLRYLARRLGPEVAEDAAHDVFVRAFKGRATYDAGRGSVAGWLFGIALNVASEHHRAARRRMRLIERTARSTPTAAVDVSTVVDLGPELAASLRRLPTKEREALLLVAWGELSYDETAAALGVPTGTVRSRISRARNQLSKAVPRPGLAVTAPTEGDLHG